MEPPVVIAHYTTSTGADSTAKSCPADPLLKEPPVVIALVLLVLVPIANTGLAGPLLMQPPHFIA